MKKATAHKNRKAEDSTNLEVDVDTAKILRTVEDQEAFKFFETYGKPTGEIARNLSDFLEKVNSVKSESLVFHLQRSDFQNWVEIVLGDHKLARQLAKISRSKNGDPRANIYRTVEHRIRELKEMPVMLQVIENSTVLMPSR